AVRLTGGVAVRLSGPGAGVRVGIRGVTGGPARVGAGIRGVVVRAVGAGVPACVGAVGVSRSGGPDGSRSGAGRCAGAVRARVERLVRDDALTGRGGGVGRVGRAGGAARAVVTTDGGGV